MLQRGESQTKSPCFIWNLGLWTGGMMSTLDFMIQNRNHHEMESRSIFIPLPRPIPLELPAFLGVSTHSPANRIQHPTLGEIALQKAAAK